MSFYLDTSFVVSAFSKETRSPDAVSWLNRHQGHDLFTSGWVSTEFASAIAFKIRTGQFDQADLEPLQSAWSQFQSANLHSVFIEDADYDVASNMIYRSKTGLRSGDALHLAICHRITATIVTFDVGLERAASQLSITAVIP